MIEDFRAGLAYWLVNLATRLYPPLLSELSDMLRGRFVVKSPDA